MKMTLLINTITTKCKSSSHKILQLLHSAINIAGDCSKLEAKVLSGDTPISPMVFVDNNSELCVFAKFCFETAMWNPDKTVQYDMK